MGGIQRKSIRKLVTLPPDLAERVERFRMSSGATSESDALKALIESGLKMQDTPDDLFARCEKATSSGQSVGDIINLVTADHPLVDSTVSDRDGIVINLKASPDTQAERFRYAKVLKEWYWEVADGFNSWNKKLRKISVQKMVKEPPKVDDDIPF